MSYVRKIVALILSVIFCAVLVICVGVVFSLKNVNVSFMDYSGEYVEDYNVVNQKLQSLKGLSIFSVNSDDVLEVVDSVEVAKYVSLVSVERVYPSTINVVLEERVERFAVYKDGGYDIYDSNGKFVRASAVNENNVDSSPNVLIEGEAVAQNVSFIAEACSVFYKNFGAVRSALQSVTSPQNLTDDYSALVFNFRSGLKIEVIKPQNMLEQKINAAYARFTSLTDAQKISGKIRSYEVEGNVVEVRTVYQVG